jgi:signal transduction histidine kinase/ActR/RegA family two-component response regulator
MRKKAVLGILFSVFFALAVFLLPMTALPVAAASGENTRTVRAGYFNNGDFMHKADDGSYEGYDIEYYYTLAGYAGWDVEFTEYKNLNEALDGLRSGEIQILSGMSRTPERETEFLFSDSKLCTSHIAVQTRADDDRFSAGDPSTMQGMTCGILKGSNIIDLYETWCKKNGIVPDIKEYDSLAERNEGLASGEVDAIAGGSTLEGAQRIAEFPSLDLFFMMNAKETELCEELDRAMSRLALQEPAYGQSLFNKYFPISRNTSPSLSSGEKAFIAAHGSVRVALLEDDAPFSAKTADGDMRGILPEYYTHIGDRTGLKFTFVPCTSKDDAYGKLEAGEADMIGKLTDDVFEAYQRGVILANPYLGTGLVQIVKAGTEKASTAAVPACNETMVRQMLSDMQDPLAVHVYKNAADCLTALKKGKADCVICSQPASTWLLYRSRASEYVATVFGTSEWQLTCGMAGTDDGNLLRSIINKTTAVDGSYLSQQIAADTLQDSSDASTFLNRLPVSLLMALALIVTILLILTALSLIVLIRRRKAEAELTERRTELAIREEAHRSRQVFFGNINHDMRTPLNGIRGFTALAMKSDDLQKIREYLKKIDSSANILTDLVNDTLTISKAESGNYTVKPEPNDLPQVLQEVLVPIRQSAQEKGLSFTENISGLSSRGVMVDRISLQKVMLNLLSNAVKYTPAGGSVKADCTCSALPGDMTKVVLTVSDTGIGISDAFRPHAFEPYTQEDPSNARTNGAGMGLSIVKSIVEAMNGTVELTGRKGQGTTVTVTVPLQNCGLTKKAAAPVQSGDKTVSADVSGRAKLKGRHVLVCEDNLLNMEIEKGMLENAGMIVTEAADGKQGVERFRESTAGYFDFILMDLRMPVLDGFAAVRQIRTMDRPDAADIRIFAVSADAFSEDVEASMHAGMNGHIAKPVDEKTMIDTLAGSLQ